MNGLGAPQLGKFAAHREAVDPEDVVQDAMLRFFTVLREERLRLETVDDAQAYLTTLVRNLVVDRFRRDRARCRDVTVSLDEFMIPVPAMAPLMVEANEALELRTDARQNALAFWGGSDRARPFMLRAFYRGEGSAKSPRRNSGWRRTASAR